MATCVCVVLVEWQQPQDLSVLGGQSAFIFG